MEKLRKFKDWQPRLIWFGSTLLFWTACVGMLVASNRRGNDFHVFWTAGRHLLAGDQFYRPEDHWMVFKYFPAWAILMSPFALLPEKVALALFNIMQFGFWFRAAQIWAGWLGFELKTAPQRLLLLVLVLNPLSAEVSYGQLNGSLFLGGTLLFMRLEAESPERPFRAGLMAAALMTLKLNFGILMVYAFLRNWRTLGGFVTGMLGLHMVTALYFRDLLAAQVYHDWFSLLMTQSAEQYYIFEAQGLLRFFHTVWGDSATYAWLTAVAALIAVGWVGIRQKKQDPVWNASYWLAVTFLLSPLAWWYLVLFTYPMIFFLLRQPLGRIEKGIVWVCLAIDAIAGFNTFGRYGIIAFKQWQGFFATSIVIFAMFAYRTWMLRSPSVALASRSMLETDNHLQEVAQ
jgi:Glycosyltransferase family 87